VIKNLEKSKVAVLAVGLVCALAFLINHLATGATTSAGESENNLSTSQPVKEIEGYRNWTKVNAVPQLMPKRVAADCAMWVSRAGGVIVNGDTNPHRDKYFTVYVNDIGRKAMLTRKKPIFPEGTVIVKEKLTTKDSQTPELLTVMIKQQQGFNPASGDWEYMVVDGTGTKVEGRGNLQNCQSCHLANQKTDYIFRTYLPEDVASKLK
jgi:Cytochrome P460